MSSSRLGEFRAVAERAALEAGQILRARFSSAREVQSKGFRDIVTDADFAADDRVRSIILQHFSSHSILSEEDRQATTLGGEWQWVIDPLDGTTNYSRQYPSFCVSVGLLHNGRPYVGAIYDPLREEMYAAAAGEGATLNGTPIAPSRVYDLASSVIGLELPRDPALRAQAAACMSRVSESVITVRICGSAALSLCYVAAGRLDGYFHYSLSAWDVAAALAIVSEAGGQVTRLDGRPADLAAGDFLASNGELHEQLLPFFR